MKTLTQAVVTEFPDFQPYGGTITDVIPHLTIVESSTAPLEQIETEAASLVPFTRRIASLDVLAEDRSGRWQLRWRVALGGSAA